MPSDWGILFKLDAVGYDGCGRVVLSDADAAARLATLFRHADALSCRSGCGLPLSCDTAMITREEVTGIGPDLLINNPDFGTIMRKRKAVGAREAVIVFSIYRRLDVPLDAENAQAPAA